jgi:hypothetical protein
MLSNEVYLPDSRVERVREMMLLKYPLLAVEGTEFVTVRHEPPFKGQMPNGEMGITEEVVLQFLLATPHPRADVYKKPGMLLTTQATLWERGWLEAEQEHKSGHYVSIDRRDPLEVIYDGLCFKHVQDIISTKQISN